MIVFVITTAILTLVTVALISGFNTTRKGGGANLPAS